jgi:hypothetical protein
MHARVSTYEGDVDRLIDGFGRQTHLVQQLDGFGGAYCSWTVPAAGR